MPLGRMRRCGRPLTMRMRMDMLMCSVTRGGDRFVDGAEPECPRVFWLGTTCTEGPIGRPPGPVAALGVLPTLPVPDIVEPEAAAATAPAAFAEAVRLVVFGAKFDGATEDCFALFAEIKGEDL